MAAIRHLLERWGFVKLSRYGLELTPDGRIVSQRPVLDDGTGARIVGWQDGDVAIWKLANRAESVRIPRQGLPAPARPDPEDHGTASLAASEGSATSGAMATTRSTAARALPAIAAPASAATARVTRTPLAAVSSTAVTAWSADDDELAASAPDEVAAVGTGGPAAMAPASLAAAAAAAASAATSRSLAASQVSEILRAPAAISTTAPLPVVASRRSSAGPAATLESTAAAAATPNAPPAAAAAVSASPARTSAIIRPAEVASPSPVEEDDWEWTIALARARVAVEEAHSVRRPSPSPAVPVPEGRPTPRPMVVREPTTTGDWPATAPIGSIDYDDYRVATRPAIPLPSVHTAGVRPAPTTVIPVPPLPSLETTMHVRLEPVVRTTHASPPPARLAKGTGPLDPEQAASRRHAAMLIDQASANLSVGDRTRPGVAVAAAQVRRVATTLGTAAPATSDPTRPGIALPPAARAVALPSIKRRTAPR